MTDPTLHRTNLNLNLADVAWLEHTYGHGWTAMARELLHQRIEQIKHPKELLYETNVDSRADPTEGNPES